MEPFPKRRKLPHEIPEWVDPAQEIYFITICSKPRGQRQLTLPETWEKLIESVRFRHDAQTWFVHVFLVMPDHIHALLSFSRTERNIQTSIAAWKAYTAKTIGIRWQSNFFEHRLRSNESFEEKAEYIRNNPVRAGLVEKPDDWSQIFIGR